MSPSALPPGYLPAIDVLAGSTDDQDHGDQDEEDDEFLNEIVRQGVREIATRETGDPWASPSYFAEYMEFSYDNPDALTPASHPQREADGERAFNAAARGAPAASQDMSTQTPTDDPRTIILEWVYPEAAGDAPVLAVKHNPHRSPAFAPADQVPARIVFDEHAYVAYLRRIFSGTEEEFTRRMELALVPPGGSNPYRLDPRREPFHPENHQPFPSQVGNGDDSNSI